MNDLHENKLTSIKEVVNYLDGFGWKVSLASAYRHEKDGKLLKRPEGYLIKDLERYMTFLKRKDGSSFVSKKSAATLDEKQSAEARKISAQADHWELRAKILRGEYCERSSYEAALAMRAQRFRSDDENDIRTYASEKCRLLNGDPEKIPELIQMELELLDKRLLRYQQDAESDLPKEIDLERLSQIEN